MTDHNTDQGLLCQTAEKAKELLAMDVIEVVADKGYDSRKDIMGCVSNGIIPNVPSNMIKRNGSPRILRSFVNVQANYGGPNEDRTPDLLTASQARCHLSQKHSP